MATTIKVINKLKDAIPYSDMGLLWIKYSTGDWFPDKDAGYWSTWSDPVHTWACEQDVGILYGISLED